MRDLERLVCEPGYAEHFRYLYLMPLRVTPELELRPFVMSRTNIVRCRAVAPFWPNLSHEPRITQYMLNHCYDLTGPCEGSSG